MYGTMILITITGVSTFIIVNHYRDIYEEGKGGEKLARCLVPKEWFVLIGFTIICVFLPFVKSQALRFEFLAPTGAQEVSMSVCVCVCPSVVFLNSSLNHKSSYNLHAIFVQS